MSGKLIILIVVALLVETESFFFFRPCEAGCQSSSCTIGRSCWKCKSGYCLTRSPGYAYLRCDDESQCESSPTCKIITFYWMRRCLTIN